MKQCSRCHVKEDKRDFHTEKMCVKCHFKRITYHKNNSIELKWRVNNRERLQEYNKKARFQLKTDAIKKYGNCCAKCNESNLVFLTIDHINGGGRQHIIEIGQAGAAIYRWLRNNDYPFGFQVLCFNCNCGKNGISDLRIRVLNHYCDNKPICACCGITDPVVLTVDHINGRKKNDKKTGKRLYWWLIKNHYPSEFRILCYNCNCARRGGLCPHQLSL